MLHHCHTDVCSHHSLVSGPRSDYSGTNSRVCQTRTWGPQIPRPIVLHQSAYSPPQELRPPVSTAAFCFYPPRLSEKKKKTLTLWQQRNSSWFPQRTSHGLRRCKCQLTWASSLCTLRVFTADSIRPVFTGSKNVKMEQKFVIWRENMYRRASHWHQRGAEGISWNVFVLSDL